MSPKITVLQTCLNLVGVEITTYFFWLCKKEWINQRWNLGIYQKIYFGIFRPSKTGVWKTRLTVILQIEFVQKTWKAKSISEPNRNSKFLFRTFSSFTPCNMHSSRKMDHNLLFSFKKCAIPLELCFLQVCDKVLKWIRCGFSTIGIFYFLFFTKEIFAIHCFYSRSETNSSYPTCPISP